MLFIFGRVGGREQGTSGKNANLIDLPIKIPEEEFISKNVPSCKELLPSPTTIAGPRSHLLKPKNSIFFRWCPATPEQRRRCR